MRNEGPRVDEAERDRDVIGAPAADLHFAYLFVFPSLIKVAQQCIEESLR
jgi:hypothetical protein